MLTRLSHLVMRSAQVFCGALFAGLIVTVAMQVLTRNVLHVPMLWTSDVAQLLFSWLIFLGAAIGLRQGAHYDVDLLPKGSAALNHTIAWFGIAMGAIVIFILVWHGWALTAARARGQIQSIGISRLWLYLPIPLSGGLMALFLVEMAVTRWRDLMQTRRTRT